MTGMKHKLADQLRGLATHALANPLAQVRGSGMNIAHMRYCGISWTVAVTLNK